MASAFILRYRFIEPNQRGGVVELHAYAFGVSAPQQCFGFGGRPLRREPGRFAAHRRNDPQDHAAWYAWVSGSELMRLAKSRSAVEELTPARSCAARAGSLGPPTPESSIIARLPIA